MVRFVNRHGLRECLVHLYYLPDGKMGASGKPDPKEILDDEAIYRLYAEDRTGH